VKNFLIDNRGSIAVSQALCSTHRVDISGNSKKKIHFFREIDLTKIFVKLISRKKLYVLLIVWIFQAIPRKDLPYHFWKLLKAKWSIKNSKNDKLN